MAIEIPVVGSVYAESDLIAVAKSKDYAFERVGNPVDGGMLILLSESNEPIDMSFLLIDAKKSLFKRVY